MCQIVDLQLMQMKFCFFESNFHFVLDENLVLNILIGFNKIETFNTLDFYLATQSQCGSVKTKFCYSRP